jgi:Flp pilus assembly pilin Flp
VTNQDRENLPPFQRLDEQDGASLVEYGLLVGLISVVSLLVIAAVGTHIFNAFDNAQQNIQASQPGVPN